MSMYRPQTAPVVEGGDTLTVRTLRDETQTLRNQAQASQSAAAASQSAAATSASNAAASQSAAATSASNAAASQSAAATSASNAASSAASAASTLAARSVNTGAGLLGGGTLGVDRTLSFDTTFGDGRYASLSGATFTGGVNLNGSFGSWSTAGWAVAARMPPLSVLQWNGGAGATYGIGQSGDALYVTRAPNNTSGAAASYLLTVDPSGLSINGNTAWHAGNFSPSAYVPVAGGTMSGFLTVRASGSVGALSVVSGGASQPGYLSFRDQTNAMVGEIGWSYSANRIGILSNGVWGFNFIGTNPEVNGNAIWHAGNFGRPQTGAGVGQVQVTFSASNGVAVVPAGGTHEYALLLVRESDGVLLSPGFAGGPFRGVAAGGTQVAGAAGTGRIWAVSSWRVA